MFKILYISRLQILNDFVLSFNIRSPWKNVCGFINHCMTTNDCARLRKCCYNGMKQDNELRVKLFRIHSNYCFGVSSRFVENQMTPWFFIPTLSSNVLDHINIRQWYWKVVVDILQAIDNDPLLFSFKFCTWVWSEETLNRPYQ